MIDFRTLETSNKSWPILKDKELKVFFSLSKTIQSIIIFGLFKTQYNPKV
jgi:hypothetical protein